MTDFSNRRTMMVDTQVRPSDVTKFPIIEAMLAVPREAYVPHAAREAAYMGENLTIAGIKHRHQFAGTAGHPLVVDEVRSHVD